ncbi:DUF6875 domain-containing protein [Kineosporia babensis]|uniref:DUF6875 domain-containing protein n=1 Tax=Kineosporia babensis TaxID=499548 RepID=A0A9X1NQ68_9ACTN|nr:hypothetical protein [Kineosporia babensis]MCD5317271.1 hypothetical protein [Kineosporia babensis]
MIGMTPHDIEIANSVLEWGRSTLAMPSSEVHRPYGDQVLCPFVGGSIKSNAFRVQIHSEITGVSIDQLNQAMLSYADHFRTTPPFSEARQLNKALVIVFPNIDKDHYGVLDLSQHQLKSDFVTRGLMLGQFHPRCQVRGAWNHGFRASVSDWPIMAIRNMAIHDIIFLRESAAWFTAYNLRFGDRFKRDQVDDDARPFAEIFYTALAQHRN